MFRASTNHLHLGANLVIMHMMVTMSTTCKEEGQRANSEVPCPYSAVCDVDDELLNIVVILTMIMMTVKKMMTMMVATTCPGGTKRWPSLSWRPTSGA